MTEPSTSDPMDFSQSTNCPLSYILQHHDQNAAFVIHRNKNKNVVVYSGSLDPDSTETSPKLSSSDPLHIYWIMFEEQNHPTEGLNLIERNTAYGAKTKILKGGEDGSNANEYEVLLAALKGKPLVLTYDPETKTTVATGVLNDVEGCVLRRVFVKSKTRFGMPKVEYVEIHGVDPDGNEVMERVEG